jgi:prepilin-type N-terminal cleavage/methylation domain-containing protein
MISQLPTPRSAFRVPRSALRSAFTLVEMLVAMALTLILVYAIAHFYAIIGDSVKDGRGMIEMNQQLRAVTQRLKLDLEQLTIPAVPWADEGGAAGYLYIKEGPSSDSDVNGNGLLDADNDVFNNIDANGNGIPDWEEPNVSNLLGDTDDILGLTIRAAGIPFSGIMPQIVTAGANDGLINSIQPLPYLKSSNPPLTRSTTSLYAEVVWWTSFTDTNANGTWGLNEPRFIHRRQLLIRPDLNIFHPGDTSFSSTPYFFRIPVPTGANLNSPETIWLYDVYQYCDVSIRPIGTNAAGTYFYFAANSLADLAQRQNRFMHMSSFSSPTAGVFPYALDLNPGYAGNLNPNILPDNPTTLANTVPRHFGANSASHYRWVLFDGGRKGEDVMLSNVLAFDIRVYDPDAVVRSAYTGTAAGDPVTTTAVNNYQFSADPIQPGDPGYAYALANNFPTTHSPYPILGTGAYVDLGYGYSLLNIMQNLNGSHSVTGTVPTSVTAVPRSFALLFLPNTSNSILSLYGSPNVSPAYQPMLGNSRFAGLPSAPFSYFLASVAAAHASNATTTYQNTIGLTWDSWTLAYERDGINQDFAVEAGATVLTDEGTDGVDSPIRFDSATPPNPIYENGVDDANERETVPPYAHPLRGVQVRIRLYEPGTRQVRQATVATDFLNE